MSGLSLMASGALARDPERRAGSKGDFALATLRVGNGDDVRWVNVIAFAEQAERLLQLRKGDAVSVAGRCELKTYAARDGTERQNLSVVASEIAAPRPRPRQRQGNRQSGDAPAFNDGLDDIYSGGGR